ncbi:NADPH:quinone oxidoreductase family protein [Streptomyces sp. NPDC091271]|uniref:NADPH:quinone oxidoreductase family protein n=1 Tax=Streptomyces sp. NPDC091271 TaxID=3365980 RepID=UPI003818EF76
MRAVVCREYGPPESLTVTEVPDPEPGPGEVLVGVRAAAVNFPDVLLVGNRYQMSVDPPFVPGSELAGDILATGPGVETSLCGTRVFGAVQHGAFAERAVLPVAALTAIPDAVGYEEAAAFGVVHLTAYHALRSVAGVQPGEWVVVLGAAGGVGLAAVTLATLLGARVIAAASGPHKLELCRTRGAEHLIDYTTEDLRSRIKEVTGAGVHAVIDPVGGRWSEQALRATRYGGTFVTIGYASGAIPAVPLNLVLLKGVAVRGMELRTFAEHRPEEARRNRAELMRLLAQGRITPHVCATFPLSRAPEALRLVAGRQALGKVLIDPTTEVPWSSKN